MKKGFTLIELLVVVLIIGILAAIALPSYQKAVEKARAMQALALLKSIGQATQVYYLANNTMPNTFSELDVQLPAEYTGDEVFYGSSLQDARSNGKWGIVMENDPQEGGSQSIHIGQLRGDYAGGGFSFWINNHNNMKEGHLYCIEKIGTFGKEDGAFCVKLFNGRQIHNAGLRVYEMP